MKHSDLIFALNVEFIDVQKPLTKKFLLNFSYFTEEENRKLNYVADFPLLNITNYQRGL